MVKKKRINAPYRNYEVNQEKILAAYKDLQVEENIILPSYEQLAHKCGLSLSTVKNHFASLNFDYICKRERLHTPEVVDAIRKAALSGKARAQKLYAQIMEGYIEKKEQKTDIVGDLNLNADISGELKVNIQRVVINSREDLARIQEVAKALSGDPTAAAPIDDIEINPDLINKRVPSVIQTADTLIFFK